MIDSDDVTSLDIEEMRLLSAQLSIGSMMAKEEQYAIPVQTESGVVGISLKVVRGDGEKGWLTSRWKPSFTVRLRQRSGKRAWRQRSDCIGPGGYQRTFRQPAGEPYGSIGQWKRGRSSLCMHRRSGSEPFFNRRLWRGCTRTAGDHRETVGYDVSGADNKAIPYCGKLCAAGAGSFAGNRCAGSGCIKQLKQGFFFRDRRVSPDRWHEQACSDNLRSEQIGFALVA